MWTSEHRRAANRSGLRYPSDLTDHEWAVVAAMIPPARRDGRKRSVNVREVLNGIFYVLWTGAPMEGVSQGSAVEEHGARLSLTLELMGRSWLSSSESPTPMSIQNHHLVQPQGRTPIRGSSLSAILQPSRSKRLDGLPDRLYSHSCAFEATSFSEFIRRRR
jgi:Putative transposase of IS4/5 family (DUF4096)